MKKVDSKLDMKPTILGIHPTHEGNPERRNPNADGATIIHGDFIPAMQKNKLVNAQNCGEIFHSIPFVGVALKPQKTWKALYTW